MQRNGGSADQSASLGLRIQRARRSAGLTQQQLCQKAQLAYSTLAKIERGAIASPSIFTIQNIAAALNLSLDALIGHESPVQSQKKKIAKSGVRFVYFDINGCLVRFFHRAFTQIAADTHARADLIETTFWHHNDAICKGEIDMNEFNARMAKELQVETFDWQAYYMDAIEPIKEMQELVTWAAQHYQVGLLSNIMPGFIEVMKAKKLLPDVEYAAVVDSSVIHAIKPEPAIFSHAQTAAGVPASAVLFIDDSRTNVMAAERMGWHVLWFDDFRPGESVNRVKKALEF